MHRLTKFFCNLTIRVKLFGGYSAVLILSFLILSFLIYSLMRTTAFVSIKNYLQMVAEKTLRLSKAFMPDSEFYRGKLRDV
ncbi:MAG TPA: hypothetical protein EYP64_03000 [Desulfarculaceae bacterium]|nr:hypothetical protein [Desulfarculaceae bacterium]